MQLGNFTGKLEKKGIRMRGIHTCIHEPTEEGPDRCMKPSIHLPQSHLHKPTNSINLHNSLSLFYWYSLPRHLAERPQLCVVQNLRPRRPSRAPAVLRGTKWQDSTNPVPQARDPPTPRTSRPTRSPTTSNRYTWNFFTDKTRLRPTVLQTSLQRSLKLKGEGR